MPTMIHQSINKIIIKIYIIISGCRRGLPISQPDNIVNLDIIRIIIIYKIVKLV